MAAAGIRIDNPSLRTPENGWFRFQIGAVEATSVSDGRMLPHDIGDFFPGLPHDDLVAAKARAGVQGTHFSIEQNCLVLRYPGHVVLFDTGMGTDPVYSWAQSGLLLRSMAAAGIDPAQVTEVVLTLAHSDHAWGLVDDAGAPNFPQAQVFVPPVDFEHWTDLTKEALGGFTADFVRGARRALLGYEERLTLFDGDGEVLPWVRAAASPGHSPWHCSYIIGSGPGACLFLGDVAHKAHLQMAHPDCAFAYDHDPVMAKQTRAAPMGRAADEGFSVIG